MLPPIRASLLLLTLLSSALLPQETGTSDAPNLSVRIEGATTLLVLQARGRETVLRELASGAILEERLISTPGSPSLAVIWTEVLPDGRIRDFHRIAPDHWNFRQRRPRSRWIRLRYATFDPAAGEPSLPADLRAGDRCRQWIVTFETPPITPWREAVREAGGRVGIYLADQSHLVRMDAEAARRVRALPFVRWVGPFHPAYRLEAPLLDPRDQASGAVLEDPLTVNIVAFERGERAQETIGAAVRALGGEVLLPSRWTGILRARVPLDALHPLAHLDDVLWIDRWSPPENDMNIARDFHGALAVAPFGYDGSGVRGEVLDGGTETTHPDLNPIVHGTMTASSHGTATFGQVFSSGAGNANATGTLHMGTGIAADYSFLGDRYVHTAELVDPLNVYQAVFQTNSWGSSQTSTPTSATVQMDTILFDMDITICQSQSNTGSTASRPQAWAKGIVAVGGIRHHNTLTRADDNWGNGASIGPASDGRIKPDLASFYDQITTTDRVGSAGYAGGNYTTTFGGTSGATPIVAGMFGLFYAMWSNGEFGNPVTPGASVFENRPHNTTAKAVIINTAAQWTFQGTTHDLTRVHQGWGGPDLANLYALRSNMLIVDEDDVIEELETKSYHVTVTPGTPALKATLHFRDPPGNLASTIYRINDLSLRLISPSGTVYWGNNGLLSGMWSTPGGSPNAVDTVENVFVQNPEAGVWSVQVIAHEINQDSHLETNAVDADYALVVSGVAGTAAGFSIVAATSGGGIGDLTLGFANIPAATTHGFTLVSFDTQHPLAGGPVLGIHPDPTTFQVLTTPAAAGHPLHWLWPVNAPLFPAATLSVPAGGVPFTAGTILDVAGVGLDPAYGVTGVTEVRRLTF